MKVTDFSLAQHIIKDLCRMERVPFVDIAVSFNSSEGIAISESKNVCHTIYQIICGYINYSEKITGQQILSDENSKEEFLTNLATSLRAIEYSENVFSDNDIGELSLQGLYQRPLVWILMKDLICPIYDTDLENVRVVTGKNPQVDIAHYFEEGEVDAEDYENYPFIFVNEIDNKAVLNSLLLVEAIKAHGLDPAKVLLDIFESELFDKFDGLLKIAFNDNDEARKVFIHTLVNVLRIEGLNTKKTFAQSSDGERPEKQNQFWFMGLIEGMLDRTRGSDWSTTKELQPYVEAFWNKVEHVKKAKGGQNVTFNELLQLKREEGPKGIDPTRTLQQLLSSDRVW